MIIELRGMVYCVKCGARNEDDAKFCSICGAPLYLPPRGEVGSRGVNLREKVRGKRLNTPRGNSVIGLAIGLIILLAGLSLLLKELYQITIPWWPIAIMILGVFIIVGAILSSRRDENLRSHH